MDVKARLSRELVELERNVPMEAMSIPSHFRSVKEFRMEALNEDRLLAFYDRMGFRDLKKRIKNKIKFGRQTTSNNSGITSGRYDSILEGSSKLKGNSETVSKPRPPKKADAFSQRYASILEPKSSSIGTPSLLDNSAQRDAFQVEANYTRPPEADEFDDVPF